MEWKDKAILIGTNNFRDSSSIATLFTENHGVKNSVVRRTKSNNHILNNCNILEIEWKGRLEEHMGNITILNSQNLYSLIYNDKAKLYLALSMCDLLRTSLQENEKHQLLFSSCLHFLGNINHPNYLYFYICFEKDFLHTMGYGLDLEECGATHTKESLKYISPKTGRAICEKAGEEYKNKLFRLPQSLKVYCENFEDQVYSINILGYFITKHLYNGDNNLLPFYRKQLKLMLDSK